MAVPRHHDVASMPPLASLEEMISAAMTATVLESSTSSGGSSVLERRHVVLEFDKLPRCDWNAIAGHLHARTVYIDEDSDLPQSVSVPLPFHSPTKSADFHRRRGDAAAAGTGKLSDLRRLLQINATTPSSSRRGSTRHEDTENIHIPTPSPFKESLPTLKSPSAEAHAPHHSRLHGLSDPTAAATKHSLNDAQRRGSQFLHSLLKKARKSSHSASGVSLDRIAEGEDAAEGKSERSSVSVDDDRDGGSMLQSSPSFTVFSNISITMRVLSESTTSRHLRSYMANDVGKSTVVVIIGQSDWLYHLWGAVPELNDHVLMWRRFTGPTAASFPATILPPSAPTTTAMTTTTTTSGTGTAASTTSSGPGHTRSGSTGHDSGDGSTAPESPPTAVKIDGTFVHPNLLRWIDHVLLALEQHPVVSSSGLPPPPPAATASKCVQAARVLAVRRGRPYVTPGDVRAVLPLLVVHRVPLPARSAVDLSIYACVQETATVDVDAVDIVRHVLAIVPAPV